MAKKTKTTKKAKKVAKKAAKSTAQKNTTSPKKASSGISPLSDRIVVRPLSDEEMGTRSPSGIIIPDTVSKEKPEQGIVVEVGPGKYEDGKRVPLSVKVGDRVVFSKYGYDEVKIGGAEYYIVAESSVLAVINQ